MESLFLMPKKKQSEDKNFKVNNELVLDTIEASRLWCQITMSKITLTSPGVLMVSFTGLSWSLMTSMGS